MTNTTQATNRAELSGVLIERQALRYTPAGIAVLDARLGHGSEVLEAGHPRRIEFEAALRFSGAVATRAEALAPGDRIVVSGFLAARRKLSRSLVLHVTEFARIH